MESLRHCKATGAPPRSTPQQRAQIPHVLAQGEESFGFRGDIWTQPRVSEVIRCKFDVSYHPSQVGRILKDCGWSRQKPVRRATQRHEEAIQRWREERWPQVNKGYRRKPHLSIRRPIGVLPAAAGIVHLCSSGQDTGYQGVCNPRPSFSDEWHHAQW